MNAARWAWLAGVLLVVGALAGAYAEFRRQSDSGTIAAVPWADSTPGPAVTKTPRPAPTIDPAVFEVRPCRADDLAAAVTSVDGNLWRQTRLFIFANRSSEPCRLQGSPSVVNVLDPSGEPVPASPHLSSSCSSCGLPVVLEPGDWDEDELVFVPGTAQIALTWSRSPYDTPTPCPVRSAAVVIELPNDGGLLKLQLSTAKVPGSGDGCTPVSVDSFRGMADPNDMPPAPALRFDLTAPVTVAAGGDVRFTVSITNKGDAPHVFEGACPNYRASLVDDVALERHSLNCDAARVIEPGATVVFEMRLSIPSGQPLRTNKLTWELEGYGGPYAVVSVVAPVASPA